jgi:hypothetical protein
VSDRRTGSLLEPVPGSEQGGAPEPAEAGREPRRARPRDALLLVAALAVGCQLWAAASHGKEILDATSEFFDEPRRTLRGADLAPLSSFASTQALLLARETIPADATFAVAVGDGVGRGEEVAVAFQHWLVPRRRTSLEDAEWVIVYRRPADSLDLPVRRVVDLGPAADAVEVARG